MASSKVDVPDTVFGREYNESLIHQVVVAFQANARQGTRAQKDREQVRHSTKKPFKQKGTGRARAGMTSSPLWRGGGRIFPNMPDENFSHKLNKKMYRAGMAAILSQLAREGRLAVVDSISIEAPKTKLLAAKFKAMGLDSVLVISDVVDDNLLLASRNLANVLVVEPRYADPLSLVFYKKVLVTKAAYSEGRLASVLLAPIAYQRLFHADGELAIAHAAAAQEAGLVLSAQASVDMEAIAAPMLADPAAGPLWFQLYWRDDRDFMRALLKRVQAA
eukprot:gene40647-49557_t